MSKIFIIAKNTFTETVRQPVFMIILAAAAFMISFSPSYAMFTLMEDIKLLKDMGLATMLVAGLLQAVFSAVRVVSHEIENKTIFTVLTKPVSRGHVVFGKFIGIALACAASMYLLSIFLVMALRVGVPEAAYSPINRPLIYGQLAALIIALGLAAFSNYFNDRPFGASLFIYSFITFTLVFLVFGFLDMDMNFQAFLADADLQVLKAAYLVLVAVFAVSSIAVALAVRFGAVFTIGFCVSLFIIGLISDHIFGRFAGDNIFAAAAYSVFPNMQVFWVSDAVTEGVHVPAEYLLSATLYGIIFSAAAVIFGMFIFELKESV
jgi:ABC-2 type transport system permease protein